MVRIFIKRSRSRFTRRAFNRKSPKANRIVLAPLLLVAFLSLVQPSNAQQAETNATQQFWPSLNVTFEPGSRTYIQVIEEEHYGEDAAYQQWKVGTLVSYRLKRIIKPLLGDIDKENEYNLAVGGGYEFIKTDERGSYKQEHRIVVQLTPKYVIPLGFLLQDRNRSEFRWVDGKYDFRYRNRLSVDRPINLDKLRFIPYATGELFWDRNHHAWNENQYAFGVRWPYKKLLRVDTYYMRQNCTTCSSDPLNIWGVKVNLFFHRK